MVQKFQSTLPRGERHSRVYLCSVSINFNPRSHEGSDKYLVADAKKVADFNPRSHEGSDAICRLKQPKGLLFQSTLPRGERPILYDFLPCIKQDFNPRSHEGSDQTNKNRVISYIHFNPRSHEGSDYKSAQKLSVFYTLLLLSLHNLMNNYNTFSDNI